MKATKKTKKDEYHTQLFLKSKSIRDTCFAAYMSQMNGEVKGKQKEEDKLSFERKIVNKHQIGL